MKFRATYTLKNGTPIISSHPFESSAQNEATAASWLVREVMESEWVGVEVAPNKAIRVLASEIVSIMVERM